MKKIIACGFLSACVSLSAGLADPSVHRIMLHNKSSCDLVKRNELSAVGTVTDFPNTISANMSGDFTIEYSLRSGHAEAGDSRYANVSVYEVICDGSKIANVELYFGDWQLYMWEARLLKNNRVKLESEKLLALNSVIQQSYSDHASFSVIDKV